MQFNMHFFNGDIFFSGARMVLWVKIPEYPSLKKLLLNRLPWMELKKLLSFQPLMNPTALSTTCLHHQKQTVKMKFWYFFHMACKKSSFMKECSMTMICFSFPYLMRY